MVQLAVPDFLTIGLPGQLADLSPRKVASYINGSRHTFLVTITAIDLETTVTINGTAFTVNSAPAAKTKAELVDLLVTAINAGAEPVLAVDNGDTMYVEGDVVAVAMTCIGTTNCTTEEKIPADATVDFGLVVVQDVITTSFEKDKIAHLPTLVTDITTAGRVCGVTMHTQAVEQALVNADNVGYPIQSGMSVLRQGNIYVLVEDAVEAGAQAFVRAVAGAGEKLGAIRSDVDGTDAGALPYSRFKTSAAGGGIAVLEINMP